MSAVSKSKASPSFIGNKKGTSKNDDILKPGTEVIQMKILKVERPIYWRDKQVSFEIFTKGNREISLFYNILLKEQKKDPQKGEVKYVDSFGMSHLKNENCKLSININSEVMKKVKTKHDIETLLGKILAIKMRTNEDRGY